MATKLSLYNNALLRLNSRKLDTLTENRKSRRVLDTIWDSGFVRRILENGQFNFAIKSFESVQDTSVALGFGYNYAHKKPDDWVRTITLSTDEYFTSAVLQYEDEGEYWYCDYQKIYAKIISDDVAYGGDLSKWTESMSNYAELYLALKACKAITSSDTLYSELEKEANKAKRHAAAIDAMNEPVKFAPMGSWARARYGSGYGGGGRVYIDTT